MFRWALRRWNAAWRFSPATAVTALVGAVGLVAPAAGQVPGQPPAAYTLTPDRITASVAAVVGLISAITGGLALVRSAGRGNGRRGAILALVLGPIGGIIGGLVVATAKGGLCTGHGLGGGIVAMVLGLIGMGLGELALARSRRTRIA